MKEQCIIMLVIFFTDALLRTFARLGIPKTKHYEYGWGYYTLSC
jgi:hypothetical protein